MIAYNIVTIICLCLLSLTVLYIIVAFFAKKRVDRIAFLRSFKKGKCVAIYLICIPLFYIGYLYKSNDYFGSIFSAIAQSAELIVLKYKAADVSSLMNDLPLYNFTIYYAFVLVTANAIVFIASLIGQWIWTSFNLLKFSLSKKEKLIIIGGSSESVSLYKSASKYSALYINKFSKEDEEYLYANKIKHLNVASYDSVFLKVKKYLDKRNSKIKIVVNYYDGRNDLNFCSNFIKYIDENKDKQDELFDSVRLYVYGDSHFQSVYEDMVNNGSGIIEYIDKYQRIAIDFVDKYPLTQFMNNKQIDYENFVIRDNIQMNVCFIGFGRINQQLFLTSVANNQFIDKEKEVKPVNYFIFDKVDSKNNKNLNHNYYRYRNEVSKNMQDKYLPLVDLPAREKYEVLDINDTEFYGKIREIVSRDPDDINYLVISFGDDLENIDLAKKLLEKKYEWGVNNVQIFVRTKETHLDNSLAKEQGCYFFGNTNEVVYNIDSVVSDKFFKMAYLRNRIYNLEYEIAKKEYKSVSNDEILKFAKNANRWWYTAKTQFERESNLYCCLSLRMKLHLMGLDYVSSKDGGSVISKAEYLKLYAENDEPKYLSGVTAGGKPIVDYPIDFADSRRRNMAILEHYRWNAFMISKGFVPATIDQILNDKKSNGNLTNGKNYVYRRHGNITTFDGLVTFRKMISERDNVAESKNDVIKYDYQILDDACWLLEAANLKMVKK